MVFNRAHFFFAPSYKMSAQQTWYPFYDIDLGQPLADHEPRYGGFWRRFEKGAVAVNPTSGQVLMSLPAGYRALAGEEVGEISLGPKDAAILLLAPVDRPGRSAR